MSEESSGNDLPMSANLQDITIKHFELDLSCKIEARVFDGSIILWCHPTVQNTSHRQENYDYQQEDLAGKLVRHGTSSSNPTDVNLTTTVQTFQENCESCCRENKSHDKNPDSTTGDSTVSMSDESCCRNYTHLHSGSSQFKEDSSVIKTSGIDFTDNNVGTDRSQALKAGRDEKRISDWEGTTCDHTLGFNIPSTDGHPVYPLDNIKQAAERNISVDNTTNNLPFISEEHRTGKSSNRFFETHSVQQDTVKMKNSSSCSRFVCPSQSDNLCMKPFKIILDSHKLDVSRAESIYLEGDDRIQFEENPDRFLQHRTERGLSSVCSGKRCEMQVVVKEHCIHLFVHTSSTFPQLPHAVQVWYHTEPEGPSLKWTTDQDGNPCVFTIGHFLSNRSLFPSQDAPTALTTWQASVTVDATLTVLLTGDRDPEVAVTENGKKKFTFFTNFPMPSSTFSIAVGHWRMEKLSYGLLDDELEQQSKPAIRLFFPVQLEEQSLLVLGGYLPRCMLQVQKLLGTYPFHRLDVLIVPACFDSLGLASPSLLFLSQSVLCPDGSMSVRAAHELCHTWFGIVIGPLDWTEEWMTEGFCTYLEDILHAQVMQLGDGTENFLELRAELHRRVLLSELKNTEEDLQSLRPNRGIAQGPSTAEETKFLKNGMNVEKKFMQVHYLKGYFLLKALQQEVGRDPFLGFLKNYVQKYIYQLVTSQDFLQMFFSTFPDVKGLSVESINAEWLDCPDLPQKLSQVNGEQCSIVNGDNVLSAQVSQQLTMIMEACRYQRGRKRRGGPRRRVVHLAPQLKQLVMPQVVLLFDRLLEEEQVPGHILDLLKKTYGHHLDNAEVFHRWCELVVKHKHRKCYPDLELFLINHQAMGVYLYGEAMISQCPHVVQVVRNCFQRLQHDMPEGVCRTISAMLFAR